MKKYEIFWKDHFSESGWKDESDLEKWVRNKKKGRCRTVGYIAYQDKDVLVIAGSHDGEDCFGDFQAIYKNHITKRKVISG